MRECEWAQVVADGEQLAVARCQVVDDGGCTRPERVLVHPGPRQGLVVDEVVDVAFAAFDEARQEAFDREQGVAAAWVGDGGAVVAAGTPAQVAENGVGASAEYLAAAIKLIGAAT